MSATKDSLLREAETLMRTRGFAAFSYADLSLRVGIRKASIHHHFPSKEELGGALIDNYLTRFEDALRAIIDEETRATIRLDKYSDFFIASVIDGMLPLCGALSAELSALPPSIRKRVRRFFTLHLSWLEDVVRAGIAAKELRAELDAKSTATLILSALEGASFVAWAMDDASLIKPTIQQLVASLEYPRRKRARSR